jgi:hypothetical protein
MVRQFSWINEEKEGEVIEYLLKSPATIEFGE